MKTMYVAWQHPLSRGWFPVGRLVRRETPCTEFEFGYIKGAEQAKRESGFLMVPGFPELDRRYTAPEFFPTLDDRIMNLKRPDRPDYLAMLGMDPETWDAVTELSLSGGHVHSDSFEAFPEIAPDKSGRFATRFIMHGLRFTNSDSVRRSELLKPGETLEMAFELNNPETRHGILVKTTDHYVLGWLPRYLVDGMHRDDAWMVTDVKATVAQVNRDAPLSHRLLVNFNGRLPAGFSPMRDLPQYQPIVSAEGAPTLL